jgi:predicted nucleic acid-binding protein
MKDKVFLDTAYAIALSVETDSFHDRALELADEIESQKIKLVTTRAILLEIGNALSNVHFRKAAVELLDSLEKDKNVMIVSLGEELYDSAFNLYRTRVDKEWGLIDCVSFVTMKQLGITESLTTDRHFQQAGFVTLLSR